MEGQTIDRWLEQLKTKPAHAYFLTGDKELREEAAKKACEILFCGDIHPPCGQCQGCQWFAANAHPDFHYIQSDTKRVYPVIRIETVRKLQEVIYQQPQKKYRVVWIEDIHTMRNEGQNALLKVLEEPPENLIFLLTGQIGGVLPTIRSRCRIIRLHQEEERVVSQDDMKIAGNILLLLFRDGTRKAQKELSDQKQQMAQILYMMILLLREIIAYRYQTPTLNIILRQWVEGHKITESIPCLNALLQDCLEVSKRLKANANAGLCADWLCIRARNRSNQ